MLSPGPVDVMVAASVAALVAAVAAVAGSAPGDLELIWVSQGCRPGDALMVAGWGKQFSNATVLVDGVPSPTLGRSGAAIITTVPATATAGRHTITLQAGHVTSTGSLGLNDPELWWCQGDEGQNATVTGWIRCFGRAIAFEGAGAGAAANFPRGRGHGGPPGSPPPGFDLRAELAELARSPTVSTALLGQLLARHRADEEARRWVSPTLQLAPSRPPGAALLKLPPMAGSVDGYSARFAVPAATPAGFYAVALDNGLGGSAAQLAAFISPAAPVVRGIHINTARPGPGPGPGHLFDITDYGPTGLNYSDPNHTIWGHDTYFDASGPLRAAIAAAAAAAAAARAASPGGVAPDQVVFFPPGIYNVQGGFRVPDGVYIAGAGADVTAIYVAYDDQTTAPLAYFSPAAPGGSWGLRDLSIYCLSFFYNIIHVPASPFGRFRASRLTIRADAFHNKNGVGGLGGNPRAAAWSLNANATYGGQGGKSFCVVYRWSFCVIVSLQAQLDDFILNFCVTTFKDTLY